MKKMNFIIVIASIATILSKVMLSKDLTRQDTIEEVITLSGVTGEQHFFDPSSLYFKTGNLYKLIIKNNSDSKHYFSSSSFASSIFTRKVQVNFNGSTISEVKGFIREVEVWPNQEIEWWFVPIKAGQFTDLLCKVKDKISGSLHSDMGMIGKITIE
tara:strand:- start:6635 stop:7105 length:471 start_codon:yes stop_codon:yes gene_type:complete